MLPTLVIGNKNYSSWSLRPWLAMREAGIGFTEQRIALDEPTTKADIARFSPAGRVPVLVLEDVHVWDSLAIVETLAERFPEKNLWPGDPSARAHARSISAEMHSGFSALRNDMPMNCRAMGRRVPLTDQLTKDIDRVFEIWIECQKMYDGEWLFGEFSIADAMFAPVVLRLRTYGINLPEAGSRFPRRLFSSKAMQEWLLDAEAETEVIDIDEKGQ